MTSTQVSVERFLYRQVPGLISKKVYEDEISNSKKVYEDEISADKIHYNFSQENPKIIKLAWIKWKHADIVKCK